MPKQNVELEKKNQLQQQQAELSSNIRLTTH